MDQIVSTNFVEPLVLHRKGRRCLGGCSQTIYRKPEVEMTVEITCTGCGRTQTVRKNKIAPCHGYLCGLGHCAQNSKFALPAIPEGCVRHIIHNAAAGFSGYTTRFATGEESAAVVRARNILARGKNLL